jgi:hypothetical protein
MLKSENLILIASATALLVGCAARISESDAGPRPRDYKASLTAYIEQTFYDPYSLRSVGVTQLVPGRFGVLGSGWIVCLQANAKNRMGGYTGLQRTSYLFQRDNIVLSGEYADACQGVPFLPWPEMEGRNQ